MITNTVPLRNTIVSVLSLSIAALLSASPAFAATLDTDAVEEIVEYEDIADEPTSIQNEPNIIARFGPFAVVNATTVKMAGVIDSDTTSAFTSMIAQYPGIKTIQMIDCPGSEDDDADISLARLVRKQGINTHVPANGSIRSGAVEFFLAGVKRTSDPGAQFGVHSWQDDMGRQAVQYSENDPVHSTYINYYVDMGLNPATAQKFYTFTNTVAPYQSIHFMTRDELTRYNIIN